VSEIRKSARISDCGKYRYRLARAWADGWSLPFIMLNPSTADADLDDPTIRRCMSFAQREGAGGIIVVNLFAFRSSSPAAMLAEPNRVGPDNERTIYETITDAGSLPIVCAWGASAGSSAQFLVGYMRANGATLTCLGKTKEGHPRHPLYVKGDQPLLPFH
jgi:hypothetical protein